MKKYLLIFTLGILCSCSSTPVIETDTGVVESIKLYGNEKHKYMVGVRYEVGGVYYFFDFYTNVNYRIGDTIKIHY